MRHGPRDRRRTPGRVLTEGELWARDQLQLLLRARFSPRAVAPPPESQRRAGEVRRRRPDLGRQSLRWSATGAAAWTALALAGVEPFRRRARSGLAWWGLTAVMLDWHLGMLETVGRPAAPPRRGRRPDPRSRVDRARCARGSPRRSCARRASPRTVDGVAARRSRSPRAPGATWRGLADVCFAGAALVGLRRRGQIGRSASAAELTGSGRASPTRSPSTSGGPSRRPRAHAGGAADHPREGRRLVAASTGRRRLGTALVGSRLRVEPGADRANAQNSLSP